MSLSVMVVGERLELSRGVSRLRSDHMLTIGEKKPQGKFYHNAMVGTKFTYRNLERTGVRVDVAKMGSTISHVRL